MELDPVSIKPFFEAYKLKCKDQIAMSNIEAWRYGIYVREAIVSSFNEKAKYPEQPHDLTASPSKELTDETNQDGMNVDAVKFSAWADVFNQGFIQKQQTANEPH